MKSYIMYKDGRSYEYPGQREELAISHKRKLKFDKNRVKRKRKSTK